MPHVVIANVIGTIMLIGILAIVSVISVVVGAQMSAQTVQSQLQEVTQYVSSELLSMATLVSSSPQANLTAFKFLELPTTLGNYGYSITLTNATNGSNDATGWKVVTSLESMASVTAESVLNFQSGIVVNCTGSILVPPITLTYTIYSGQAGALNSEQAAVIVVQSVNGQAQIGLGVSYVGRNV